MEKSEKVLFVRKKKKKTHNARQTMREKQKRKQKFGTVRNFCERYFIIVIPFTKCKVILAYTRNAYIVQYRKSKLQ